MKTRGQKLSEEEKYRSLFENVMEGIYQSTPDGRILTANPALVRMLGYSSAEELMSLNIATDIYVNPEEREQLLKQLVDSHSNGDIELCLRRKDGSVIYVLEHSHPVFDAEGRVIIFEGVLTDITRRKNAEAALRESEAKYQSLLETMQDGISLFDHTGKLFYFNQRKRIMLGYDSDTELFEKTAFDLIYPEDKEVALKCWEELLAKGSVSNAEMRVIRKDGSYFWAEFNTTAIRNADGTPELFMDTMRDITERKRWAEDLRIHSEHLQKIIDLVPSYIFAKDIDGRFLLTNKALADVFGLKSSQIQGKTDADYGASPEQIELYRNADLKVIEKGIPVMIPEEQVLRKDGTLGWFQTVKIPYTHPGLDIPAILGVATDITQRKEAEDELRRSEERFRKLFESHSAVKLIIDPQNGSVVDANNAAADYYGWPVDTLRKMKIYEISTMSRTGVDDMMRSVADQKGLRFEANHRLADGSIREVEVFTSRVEINGKELLHSIIHDITEKRKILLDLISAKEKAEESDRLKTAFLHNISHEIRTPLNAIVGFTALLDSSELTEEVRRHYIDMVSQSSNQLLSIISDIVDISNIETGLARLSVTDTNINRILVSAFDLYSAQAGRKKLRFNFSSTLPDHKAVVMTDATKLLQILSNLISNAIKFTLSGSVSFGYSLKGNDLEFFVSDTGVGIPENKKTLIFERFYQIEDPATLKTTGTGLGLSISRAYAELLGGKIWLDSSPGKGSAFYFTIPYSEGSASLTPAGIGEIPEKEVVTAGKTILVAEDDNVNFILIREMLSGTGATIVRAVNGEEAVKYCSRGTPVDLILMDIKMPLMDGYRAAEIIWQSRTDIPIVAVTAYAHDSDREKATGAGFAGYISKPLDKPKLISLVSKFI